MHRDARAVVAQLVTADRPVAFRDPFRLALEIRGPQVALLEVVLFERKDIVLHAIALAFFGGLGVGGGEIDRLAVRRPRDVAGGRAVARDLAGLATVGVQHVDLVDAVGIAARGERNRLAVRRPARARFTALAECQLHLVGAVGVDPEDVTDPAVRLPVRAINDERDLLAAR